MSVKVENKNNALVLTLDHGDKTKFQEVLTEWNFKDEQSLLRFFISVAKQCNEKKTIFFKDAPYSFKEVVPADHLLK